MIEIIDRELRLTLDNDAIYVSVIREIKEAGKSASIIRPYRVVRPTTKEVIQDYLNQPGRSIEFFLEENKIICYDPKVIRNADDLEREETVEVNGETHRIPY